jgi:hypothetical protein
MVQALSVVGRGSRGSLPDADAERVALTLLAALEAWLEGLGDSLLSAADCAPRQRWARLGTGGAARDGDHYGDQPTGSSCR